MPKCKERKAQKAKNWKNGAGLGAAKFFVWEIGKRSIFGNLWGGGGGGAQKLIRKRPKCKEMKAHKAKMKGIPIKLGPSRYRNPCPKSKA